MKKEIIIKGVKFEIKKPSYIGGEIPKGRELDWAICEWSSTHAYKWVIANLRWNAKEPCYQLESVGMRLAESGSRKLLKWILKFSEKSESENLKGGGENA